MKNPNNEEKTYHIWTIGCQMNEADSRHLATRLEQLGYSAVDKPENADLVVLNTCVVRQQAENRIYGFLGSLKRYRKARPWLRIALMGCLVGHQVDPELKKKLRFVNYFIAPSDVDSLIYQLAEDDGVEIPTTPPESSFDLPEAQRINTVTAFVPVILGCSHACSYCIIPSRRGGERSRPMDEILIEVRTLVEQGVKEIMLLGQIVDRYGRDFEGGRPNLSDLLREVSQIDGLERLRFLTSHPLWMTQDVLDTVAEIPSICPQMEVALQSGNTAMLKRMRRGYTREGFLELVASIRRTIPGSAIHTDIIVGFCGETEEEFMDTVTMLKEVEFDKVHIAKYSVRPGTYGAAHFEDDVLPEEKERRRKMLEEIQKEIQTRKNQVLLGQSVEVLTEGQDKGRWRGRTKQNKIVFFDKVEPCIGKLVHVRVDWAGPFSMIGTAID